MEGYRSTVPVFAMVREGAVVVAVGSAYAAGRPAAVDRLRTGLDLLSERSLPGDLSPSVLQDVLDAAGVTGVSWQNKYYLAAVLGGEPPDWIRCLTECDYDEYETFFRTVHPLADPSGWLREYFDSVVSRRLMWAAAVDGILVSVTDAPSMPYLADEIVEPGINTHPEYRQRGYAKAVCIAMIDEILRQGRTPVWSCARDNYGSDALAESLGFRLFGVAAACAS
jgi:GNAT superfamily N-acetyltransferase